MHQNGRNNDPQNIACKTEYLAMQISLKTGDELRYSGLVSSRSKKASNINFT
jgi:hypothetical protein